MGDGMETLKEVSVNVVGWETRFCPLERLSTEKGMNYDIPRMQLCIPACILALLTARESYK